MAKKRWLSRDIVIRTAAAMANEAGDAQALTLTALAERLNIRAPSLYNHIDGIEDLQYGMALHAIRCLIHEIQQEVGAVTGRDALMAAAKAYRRFAQQQPGIYGLVVRAPEPGEKELSDQAHVLLQFLLLMLASLGLEQTDALHAVRGLRAVLHGFVALEAQEGFKLELDRDESFEKLVRTYLDGLERGA